MTQAQMIEGTAEEVTRQIQHRYAGQKLRVFVEPETEEEDFTADLPTPPDTIRDKTHLMSLLQEGMEGEPQPVTDQDWAEIRQEVRSL